MLEFHKFFSASKAYFGDQRFLVELGLVLAVFSICTGEFALMGLISKLAESFELPETKVAGLISGYAMGVVIGAPVMVFVGAKLDKRAQAIWLIGIYMAANILSMLSPSYSVLLITRVVAGFPHAAFFGLSAVMAASMAPFHKRGKAISRIFLGVTFAILGGAPGATWIGQNYGWRIVFGGIAIIACCSLFLLYRYAPSVKQERVFSFRDEAASFKNYQVWFALAIASIGFCGMFGVYSYLAPILKEVTHLNSNWVAPMLVLFGLGTLIGNQAGGWLYDKYNYPAVLIVLTISAISLMLFPILAPDQLGVSVATLLLGGMVALSPALQMRLMDVSKHGQTLVAAGNHAALNFANGLGPWIGGIVIEAGYGWTAPGYVGSGMAMFACLLYYISTRPYFNR